MVADAFEDAFCSAVDVSLVVVAGEEDVVSGDAVSVGAVSVGAVSVDLDVVVDVDAVSVGGASFAGSPFVAVAGPLLLSTVLVFLTAPFAGCTVALSSAKRTAVPWP